MSYSRMGIVICAQGYHLPRNATSKDELSSSYYIANLICRILRFGFFLGGSLADFSQTDLRLIWFQSEYLAGFVLSTPKGRLRSVEP